jgi:protein-S-isoprenylcysteine O-methyltransferase Ste14
MKSLTLWQIELIPWYIFLAYWVINWLRVERTKTRERSTDRLITLVVVILAYNLLFSQWLRIGFLRLRIIPQDPRIGWAGIALTCAGVSVAIWARCCLGTYWSARVTLKEGHQLIRTGPYAYVRHPIYTGMLLGVIGTALVAGEWRGVIAVALLFAAHSRKALREESLLTREFGDQYKAYRQSTGFLFPRLWPRPAMDTRLERS